MDRGVWIGIAIGGIISLFASIVANLFHSKIVAFLDSGTIQFKEKRRRSALALHKIIAELHDGTRDKHLYMLRLSIGVNAAFMIAVGGFFSATVLFALSLPPTIPLSDTDNPDMHVRLGAIIFLLFLSSVGLFLLQASIGRFRRIVVALEDFQKYEAEFKAKWGADPI